MPHSSRNPPRKEPFTAEEVEALDQAAMALASLRSGMPFQPPSLTVVERNGGWTFPGYDAIYSDYRCATYDLARKYTDVVMGALCEDPGACAELSPAGRFYYQGRRASVEKLLEMKDPGPRLDGAQAFVIVLWPEIEKLANALLERRDLSIADVIDLTSHGREWLSPSQKLHLEYFSGGWPECWGERLARHAQVQPEQ
jgi:hypothetical protein